MKTRLDAYPEAIEYQDDGCEVSPRCLACPLPRCRFDVAERAVTAVNHGRNEAIVEALLLGEKNVAEIAYRFGLSRRSVFRIRATESIAGREANSRKAAS